MATAALAKVLEYLWSDEEEHCLDRMADEDYDGSSHIFCHLVTLDNALHGTSYTVADYKHKEDDEEDEDDSEGGGE